MTTEEDTIEALTYRIVKDDTGVCFYNNQNKLYRTCGPAIEHTNGTKEWYLNGNLHRIDGPAIEHTNGTKEWYSNGEPHSES
jgi:hypothetical protein